jgi:hypothetical protein
MVESRRMRISGLACDLHAVVDWDQPPAYRGREMMIWAITATILAVCFAARSGHWKQMCDAASLQLTASLATCAGLRGENEAMRQEIESIGVLLEGLADRGLVPEQLLSGRLTRNEQRTR